MGTFTRVELWTDVECNGGTKIAHVPDRLLFGEPRLLESIDTPESGSVEIVSSWRYISSIAKGKVFRFCTNEVTDFSEWRVSDIEDGSGIGPRTTVATLDPISADLTTGIYKTYDAVGVAVHEYDAIGIDASQVIDDAVLPTLVEAGRSYFTRDQVDPTQLFDVTVEDVNPAAIIEAIRDPSRAPAELNVVRNTNDYGIQLRDSIGDDLDTVHVRTRRNLRRTKRRRLGSQTVTRLNPRGKDDQTDRTIAFARFFVSARDTATDYVDLIDPRGGTYRGPGRFPDQFNEKYLAVIGVAFASYEIIDTVIVDAYTTRIYIADASLIAVGSSVEFRTASGLAGGRLCVLDNPAGQLAYGGVFEAIKPFDLSSGATNYAGNPIANDWANHANPPDNWVKFTTGGTVNGSYDTTHTRFGAQGYRVAATTTSGAGGVRSPEITVYDDAPYMWRFWAWIYITSADVNGFALATQLTYASDGSGVSGTAESIAVTAEMIGTYVLIEHNVDSANVSKSGQGVAIQITGAAAPFTAFDFTVVAFGCQPLAWTRLDTYTLDANDLFHAGNDFLELNALPTGYDVEVDDLYARNNTRFSADRFQKGGTLRVYDTDLGVTTDQRIMEVERFPRARTARLRLGNRDKTLAEQLTQKPEVGDVIGQIGRAIAAAGKAAVEAGTVTDNNGITSNVDGGAGGSVTVPDNDLADAFARIINLALKGRK